MYICVTHVDAATKKPCFIEPMRKGPSFPEVKGLKLEWWDQSRWPLQHPDDFPRFYGTCDDDANTEISGVIEILTEEIYNELRKQEEQSRLPNSVSPRQARLALLKTNVLDDVENAISSLEEPLKSVAKIEWEFASEISRSSPLIDVIKESLNWTDQQIVDLFVLASQIDTNDFIAKKSEE